MMNLQRLKKKKKKKKKKEIKVQNRPENSALDFYFNDLPSMLPLEDEKKVKLEPEETIAERAKLNPEKRKK